MYFQVYYGFGRDRMSDFSSVIKDMSRQRKVQCVTAVVALAGVVIWLLGFTVFNVSPGALIAALAIILFAVATVKRVNDEETLEEGQNL